MQGSSPRFQLPHDMFTRRDERGWPRRLNRRGEIETMAMTQRDDTIEAIKRLDALLEYAVMHGDEEEAERIREELRKLTESV